jgi:hypothetical protein
VKRSAEKLLVAAPSGGHQFYLLSMKLLSACGVFWPAKAKRMAIPPFLASENEEGLQSPAVGTNAADSSWDFGTSP